MEQMTISAKRPFVPRPEKPFVKFPHGEVLQPLRSAPVAEMSPHLNLPKYIVTPAEPSPETVPPEYPNTEQRGGPSASSEWKLSDFLPALPPFPPLPRGIFKG